MTHAPGATRAGNLYTRMLGLAVVAVSVWWHPELASGQAEPFVAISDSVYFLAEPDELVPFQLSGHDGEHFDNAALSGKWSFLFFGYTQCSDACPTTLAVFRQVRRKLASAAADVQFVFVSVDPERDTPERLQKYVSYFDPTFRSATGDKSEILRLAESVGVIYAKVPAGSDGDYLMDHSSAVLLTNPDGKLQGVFAAPHRAADIVWTFAKIRELSAATGKPQNR